MGSQVAKLVAFACLLVGCLFGAGSALAAPAITGTFPVASEIDTNNKIVAGPDGNVWLTVGGANDVARVTPAGLVEEFDLPGISETNGIAPGPDGNLWVPTTNKVTKFDPAKPVASAQTFSVNLINNGGQIVTGPDGLLWVASQNSVVHFSVANPEGAQAVTLSGELAPKDIDVAGSLIVIADQSGGNRVLTFTIADVQKDFAIDGPSQGVAGSPGGQIGFSAPLAVPEKAGLISPPSPAQSFELLGDPFGVAFGGDGAFWVVQFASGQLARVASDGQLTFPITGLPLESARQIAAGPGGTLWVTLQKNEAKGVTPAVVRISGVETVVVDPAGGGGGGGGTGGSGGTGAGSGDGGTTNAPSETTLGKVKKIYKTTGKRAKVKIRFSSPGATAFQCSLTRLRGKATKAAPLKACTSPKTYSLRPGRYRFQVGALNGSVADPTPAVRGFKVVRVPR